MSLPPDGRALPLLFVWDKTRSHAESQAAEGQPVDPGALVVPDEDLLARLQGQDAAALDTLFERYARIALGIALRILRDTGEAEDVAQESFLYIYQRAALFDPQKGSARALLDHPYRLPTGLRPTGVPRTARVLWWYKWREKVSDGQPDSLILRRPGCLAEAMDLAVLVR